MPDRSLALTTASVDATRAVGAAIAARLKGGDVVALSGDLGAGKTALVQGAAGALGVTLPVTSPTFVLVKHLPAPVPVVHVDVYRLERLSHVDDLDEDVFAPDVVTFVEWADRIAHLLPEERLEVRLVQPGDDAPVEVADPGPADTGPAETGPAETGPTDTGPVEAPRHVTVTLHGAGWATRLEGLEHALERWLDPDPSTA